MSDNSTLEERRDYLAKTLSRSDLDADPIAQFDRWLGDAREAALIDATAMTLATVDARQQPHARIVLLKQFDATGFCWYTNWLSDKGRELAENPKASLSFYWRELERQVRIEGPTERLPAEDADRYFHSRPAGSRFSAAASEQSQPVDSRASLEKRVAELHEIFPDGKVTRPESWGGYRLAPLRIEFWQGRADRLHDRFVYRRDSATAPWALQRLQP